MTIISVGITKKQKQKQIKQTNKKERKEQGGTEAIVKWREVNYFVVHLS